MNKRRLPLIVLLAFTFLPGPLLVGNQVPKLINYQGKLTNAVGAALPDGEYTLRFELFNQATGGQLVWGETRANVPLVGGLFNVILGGAGATLVSGAAVNDLAFAFGDAQRFLQTTVVAGPGVTTEQTLLPRQQLASVPYAATAFNGCPPGTVVSYAGAIAPEGWLLCDGGSYSRTAALYKALADAVGITFGGDENTFRVPDLRGRGAIGAGQGTGLSNRTRGQTVGAETHTLTLNEMPAHDHTGTTSTNGSHSHSTSGAAASDDGGGSDTHFALGDNDAGRGWPGVTINSAGSHSHTIPLQGGGVAHNNMQPSLVMNYIIKL
jgi:microcystin-dependent protein